MMEPISRRGFVQSVSAFAGLGLLPSWRAFQQRRQIDLTPFCEDYDEFRWSISKPFAQDGMVYATDARILCRTTLADAPALGDHMRLPAASQLPFWEQTGHDWKPWPKLRLFADKAESCCPICWGRGCIGRTMKCSRCDGDGTLVCDEATGGAYFFDADLEGNIFNRTCDACQGSGYVSPDGRCDYCGGTGNTDRPALQKIGHLVVAGHYDARVRTLGDVEYAICGNAGCATEDMWLVKFRGDGFEGLLMPIDMSIRQKLTHV